MKSTIDFKEISKFGKMAKNWWNENSNESALLHKMNKMRLKYILNQTFIEGKKVLEIGSGGGILSLPLIRLKANLTAIEPSEELFKIALEKAKEEGLTANFLNIPLETLEDENFDVILIMDVIEHVESQEFFLKTAESKLKNGGIMIISTINKTILADFFVKFIAEDLLKIIPKGTHESEKFISPTAIESCLKECETKDLTGFTYNPLLQSFSFISSDKMNYFLTLKKNI